MVKIMNGLKKGIIKSSFVIIVIMSIFHIGIAYIHSRDSGRADLSTYILDSHPPTSFLNSKGGKGSQAREPVSLDGSVFVGFLTLSTTEMR
ncbi:hypothetical protein DSCA_39790 [Desulfosarcina alkanivorans]|uniref:Uncharacterized protein n=1 Tax=Desulfosarcina alkanivorans TaxID=571177 RepID=A0A5K7YQ88_9BACT|nr:hypothetical protein DSCA_39790 [Desulfosarcina alkanivorans]